MSSNVGLPTPRGSGTSGYVQRNLSHLKPRDTPPSNPRDYDTTDPSFKTHKQRQPDKEILEHERKREVEVKCMELRDKLEDEGLDEEEIEERVDELRKDLLEKLERDEDIGGEESNAKRREIKAGKVHEAAARKIVENERIQKALGISPDYEEGSHWRKQEERRRARELGLEGHRGREDRKGQEIN